MPHDPETPEDVTLCLDAGGRVVAAHGPVERILNGPDVNGLNLTQLLPPDSMTSWARAIADAVQGRPHTFDLTTDRGTEHVTAAPVEPGGTVTVVTRFTHVPAEVRGESLPATGDILYRLRLQPHVATAFVSASVEDLTGIPPGQFLQDPETFLLVTHPADRGLFRAALDTPEHATTSLTLRWTRSDGSLAWTSHRLGAIRDNGRIVGVDGIARDMTSDRSRELLLATASLHDPVTGLPNATLGRDRVCMGLQSVAGTTDVVGVIACRLEAAGDLDADTIADPLFQQRIAARLRALVEGSGTSVSKIDDTTFLVVARAGDAAALLRRADEIRMRVRAPLELAGEELHTTLAVGVAVAENGIDAADDVIHDAISAAHLAALRGGDACELHSNTRSAQVARRLEAEEALRRAVNLGSFSVVYQPVVDLRTGGLVETEALARWKHPEQGLVPAGDFMQLAEETGMVVAMGRTVLVTACRDALTWVRHRPDTPPIGVNLSPEQFEDPALVEDMQAILAGARLDPGRLRLEVGEVTLHRDLARTEGVALALHEIGVDLTVDDFRGATSPMWLERWRVRAVKLDMSVTTALADPEPAQGCLATVRAAESATATLGIDLVAKGIETRLQSERLLEAGCQRGQGFWFAPPVSASVVPTLFGMDLRGARGDS
ncbi:MAG: EAL domain-containing protein [Acidimicrobiia bacterium]|nr:EAL domain-containing protein [Acidimicrobiia bacterium]